MGEKPFKRNSKTDWKKVKEDAKRGNLESIPEDVYIRFYSTLKRIYVDNAEPVIRGKQEVVLLWGPTGTGKTFEARREVGEKAYMKQPLTKWFDGYHGQENILVDEFRGKVEISHLLRWLDPYPCAVEVKGGQVFLNTKKWVFTSNIPIEQWYPDMDVETLGALRRRFTRIVHMVNAFKMIMPKPVEVLSDCECGISHIKVSSDEEDEVPLINKRKLK